MNSEQKKDVRAVVLSVTLLILVTVVGYLTNDHVSTPSPPSSRVVCLIFDMSDRDGKGRWKGWHPVASETKREEIGLLVSANAVEWGEFKTADCYERHPENPKLGQLVEQHYVEWWRWKEKKRKEVITH